VADEKSCVREDCLRLFVTLASYWKSALVGFIAALGLVMGLWTWSYAEFRKDQKDQDSRIAAVEAMMNDISYLRSDASEILDNQKSLLKNQAELKMLMLGRYGK